jgi:CcmD family protein
MTGELQGGWEYVIAAYAITWIFFSGYAASLWLRLRSLEKPVTNISNTDTSDNAGNDA